MKRCGQGLSVKIVYFRQPARRPSDIRLCPTDNPRIYRVTSDGCSGPSDFYCFTIVICMLYINIIPRVYTCAIIIYFFNMH
jgi:hypothetical protein